MFVLGRDVIDNSIFLSLFYKNTFIMIMYLINNDDIKKSGKNEEDISTINNWIQTATLCKMWVL